MLRFRRMLGLMLAAALVAAAGCYADERIQQPLPEGEASPPGGHLPLLPPGGQEEPPGEHTAGSGAVQEGQEQEPPADAPDGTEAAGEEEAAPQEQEPAVRKEGDKTPISWYYMRGKSPGEAPRFPLTQAYEPHHKVAWIGEGKKVYLTFDTGSALGDVDLMLQSLKDNDVRATYFITGNNVRRNPDFIRRLVEDGHLVVNHSVTHKDFTLMTDEEVLREIEDYEKYYTEATGLVGEKFFRFPYGRYSMHLLDLISDLGYVSVFWSTAMRDWEPRPNGADDPYNDIMGNLHDGNIILMHQNSRENIDALDRILKAVKEAGYEFALMNELY